MPYSPAKRSNDEGKSVIGYVQNLSPIKRSRKGKGDFRYASLTLQTSQSDSVEALLFSEQKRPIFQQCQESRTPVKLKDYAYTEDKEKLVINDVTQVTKPQQCEYKFQYTELANIPLPTTPILDLLNEAKEWATVSVKGKITKMKETRIVGKNKLKLCETQIADESAHIPLDIWEDHVSSVAKGEVYEFQSLQVRVWSGKKKLSTTQKTTIHLQSDMDMSIVANPSDEEFEGAENVTVSVKAFRRVPKFEKFNKCLWCKKKIPQAIASDVAKCGNCGFIKKEDIDVGITLTVITQQETGDLITLKMGDEILQKILQVEVKNMDEEEISKLLLYKENVKLTYSVDNMMTIDIVI